MEVIQLKFGDYAFPSSDENIPLQLWQEKQLTEMEVIHELKFGDYAFPSSDANSPASDTDSDSGNETMSICTTSTNFTAYSDSTSLLSLTDATSWEDLSKLPKNITGADLLVAVEIKFTNNTDVSLNFKIRQSCGHCMGIGQSPLLRNDSTTLRFRNDSLGQLKGSIVITCGSGHMGYISKTKQIKVKYNEKDLHIVKNTIDGMEATCTRTLPHRFGFSVDIQINIIP